MRAQLRLTPENLPEYLENRGLGRSREPIRVEPAGDGNINWVRRAWLDGGERSLIVKQARPGLERFPEYEVTTERIVFEARYYATVRTFDTAGLCPRVIDFDETERVLVLEDLGAATRLDVALQHGDQAGAAAGASLGAYLGAVHAGTSALPGLASRFANDDMRRLHGDHIFSLPFRPNDFPLSPALRASAEAIWRDDAAVAIADAAYRDYLEPTGVLVHGDVQGGNVLLQPDRPRLLDAEISHVGSAAFDLGILLAHLAVASVARATPEAARPALSSTHRAYVEHRGAAHTPSFEQTLRFAGIELVRRTLGAARVDAVAGDAAGIAVLALGLRWLRAPVAKPELAL